MGFTESLSRPLSVADVLPSEPAVKVGMVSLGCAKNLVDAEIMLGDIVANGMQVTTNADEADVVIVNTCAFIDSAKEESIEAILDAHQARGLRKRKDQKLVVSGCMSQRFATELAKEMPEVDAFMGLDQISQAGEIVRKVVGRQGKVAPLNFVTREFPVYTGLRHAAIPIDPFSFCLSEDCRRLQSSVQFLRDSADAWQASKQAYGIDRGRDSLPSK